MKKVTSLASEKGLIKLNNAIEHCLLIVKENCGTLCAEDHTDLARWLNELYMRRTGETSPAMSNYFKVS